MSNVALLGWTLLLASAWLASAQTEPEMAPFVIPWNDTSSGPLDLRPILQPARTPLPPVRARGDHLYAGNWSLRIAGREMLASRARLFGVNLTAGACFPDHATADVLAPHMAKLGINLVRFHFLDSTWGTPRLIQYESRHWTNWNADALDRWLYFMARLKEAGIYWNINLLVGRKFGVGDGVDPAIQRLDWKTAHAIGFFHAPHQQAQLDYAKRLLDRVNPYTGTRIADDSALAMVEINNENGLIHTWMGGELDQLPEPFASDLRMQWNDWLRRRYTSTKDLASAWKARAEPLGPELLRNPAFASQAAEWILEQHQGARAELNVETNVLSIRVLQPGREGWHVQFNQSGLRVRAGGLYTARFRMAADRPRQVTVTLMQAHDPWKNLASPYAIQIGPEWKDFELVFEVNEHDDRARFGFTELSQSGAVFRIAGISLRPGGRTGLGEHERLENGTIPIVPARGRMGRVVTPFARRDWIEFLWETERRHWRTMHAFLTEQLGVRAPVVGTIVGTSTPHLMAEFPLVDTHAYWEHPQWPNAPAWDPERWIVRNRSMADFPEEATVTALAWHRVLGRPHMVSEYNHPAPNPHASEGPLFLATMACLQDWDAITYYTWAHTDEGLKAGKIPGFFDVGQHPTILANLVVAALVFRRGDIRPATELVTRPWTVATELDYLAGRGHAWGLGYRPTSQERRLALRHRVALHLDANSTHAADSATSRDARPFAEVSDTGEVQWSVGQDQRGWLTVIAPRFRAAWGVLSQRDVDLGDGLRIRMGPTRTGFGTFALVILEGDSLQRGPARCLLTVTAMADNTDMVWKSPAMDSVGRNWGRAPSRIEVVPLELTWRGRAGTLVPLDGNGQPSAAPTEWNGELRLPTTPRTLWYELRLRAP